MPDILILNGPNLNLLGIREPKVYGNQTLDDINKNVEIKSKALGYTTKFIQSNSESKLIQAIQDAKKEKIKFIVINPAAFAHTSIALRDAFQSVALPFIEVHLSNIYSREKFRHHSYLSDVAIGIIAGLGAKGYEYALDAAHSYLSNIQNIVEKNGHTQG